MTRYRPPNFSVSLLGRATATMLSGIVHAADNSSAAADALRALTQSSVGTTEPSGAASSQSLTHTVRRGETVDMIIKRHWGQLPLSEEFMRKALMRANPQAFQGHSVHRLQAGAVLRLPGPTELHQWLVELHPASAALFRPEFHEGDPRKPGVHDGERKRWVRYP